MTVIYDWRLLFSVLDNKPLMMMTMMKSAHLEVAGAERFMV